MKQITKKAIIDPKAKGMDDYMVNDKATRSAMTSVKAMSSPKKTTAPLKFSKPAPKKSIKKAPTYAQVQKSLKKTMGY